MRGWITSKVTHMDAGLLHLTHPKIKVGCCETPGGGNLPRGYLNTFNMDGIKLHNGDVFPPSDSITAECNAIEIKKES